jgi:bifunctional DNase/RNase/pimeloyl-ACP methyl ester carboxylesterase
MIEMQVSHVGTGSQYNRVRLIDKEEHIIFPFFVGSSDARAITMALAGEFDDRPSTHDLMLAIFARYAITVRRVVISDLIRDVFCAQLILESPDGSVVEIDARPSDAIVVALRTGASIYVSSVLLEQAGFVTHQLVDLGSHRLSMHCSGEGAPTVVIEAGLGWHGSSWQKVQEAVSQFTCVVSYDRAGLGASEPSPEPRTSQDMVTDLHALLVSSGIEGPYVFVGHSVGGFTVRLYTHQYRQDVVGMVLVDVAHPDYYTRVLSVLPQESPDESIELKEFRRFATTFVGDPMLNLERFMWEASAAQIRNTALLRDIPLIVLSRGQSDPWSGFPADLKINLENIGIELQRDLVGLSSNAIHIVAEHSGHMIHFDQPSLVIDAIRKVVETVRLSRSSKESRTTK